MGPDLAESTPVPSSTVIEVSGLRKVYGATVAVADVSFEVLEGEIFGLLGPNGAGKTTTMECVEGVRKADAGNIRVLDMDPQRDATRLQKRIGVQLQESQLQKRIKVWEAVDLWTSLYPTTVDGNALLDRLGLTAKRNSWFMTLSGGQKQRLFIALALINDPEVVFLDELTTGLDPQARRSIWELVTDMQQRGKTVFLTTHSMEEAERLCDRVAIVEHGRMLDIGTPLDLIRKYCPETQVTFTTTQDNTAEAFAAIPGFKQAGHENGRIVIQGVGEDFVADVIDCLSSHGIRVRDFQTRTSNLEDVFLHLTGHSIRD